MALLEIFHMYWLIIQVSNMNDYTTDNSENENDFYIKVPHKNSNGTQSF